MEQKSIEERLADIKISFEQLTEKYSCVENNYTCNNKRFTEYVKEFKKLHQNLRKIINDIEV